MQRAPLQLYSAWFCPYAQRAWIALNHCGVPYKLLDGLVLDHSDPWESKGYKKHPGLLDANPKGLVPTMLEEGGKPVYESLICMEYATELSMNGESLLPSCPAERGQARIQASWVNKQICSPFYTVLVRKNQAERVAAFEALQRNLGVFDAMISGPFFCGEQLSIVDVAVFPWLHRIFDTRVLESFRSMSLVAPPKVQALHTAMLAMPAVTETLADQNLLLGSYRRYADATAESAVAEAVRQGKSAHDIE